MSKKILFDRFCFYQNYAKGDSRKAYLCSKDDLEAELFCLAHLESGRCFVCPYDLSKLQFGEVFTNKERLFISQKKGNSLVGACQDFKPIEGREKELIKIGERNSAS